MPSWLVGVTVGVTWDCLKSHVSAVGGGTRSRGFLWRISALVGVVCGCSLSDSDVISRRPSKIKSMYHY